MMRDWGSPALGRAEIARMIDLSAVRADTTEDEVRQLAQAARRHRCACASTLPSLTPLLVHLLDGQSVTPVGGNVSFPSGGGTTMMKAAETREFVGMGCGEIDVMINIGMLRSGRDVYVLDDLRAVVEAAQGLPVKAILECHYLTPDEIRRACTICVEASAAYVKTSTGWAPTGATIENITLIKATVGDAIGIKASGGIRSRETIREMHGLGARRFGIGLRSVSSILEGGRR